MSSSTLTDNEKKWGKPRKAKSDDRIPRRREYETGQTDRKIVCAELLNAALHNMPTPVFGSLLEQIAEHRRLTLAQVDALVKGMSYEVSDQLQAGIDYLERVNRH